MRRARLTNEQLDRMITLAQRQLDLLEQQLLRNGTTKAELQAAKDKTDAKCAREWANGAATMHLGGASFTLDFITDDGKIAHFARQPTPTRYN